MQIKNLKSCILFHKVSEALVSYSQTLFPYPKKDLHEGIKYLGFQLKPLSHHFIDWLLLYNKIEDRISLWVNMLLSQGGRITLLH